MPSSCQEAGTPAAASVALAIWTEACSGTLPSGALCLGTEGYTLTLLMPAMSSLSVRSCSFMSPVKFFSFFIDAFQVAY